MSEPQTRRSPVAAGLQVRKHNHSSLERANYSPASNSRPDTKTSISGEFDRALLPDASEYYRGVFDNIKGCGEWVTVPCVFHEDRSPSLRLNLTHGGFCCMGCGEHGGDVLAFHMRHTGATFVDASKALGAWRDASELTAEDVTRVRATARLAGWRSALGTLAVEATVVEVGAAMIGRGAVERRH